MDITQEKQQIRSQILRRVRGLTESERAQKSREAADLLINHLDTINDSFSAILSFLSMGTEIDTAYVNDWAAAQGIPLAFPRIEGRSPQMHFLLADHRQPDEMERHPYGFIQPAAGCRIISPEHAIIIVPGMGFTPDHRRLGRGGGFYDRYLAEHDDVLLLAGICFEEQMVGEIPTESHDRQVDLIVTDKAVY